MSVVFIAQAFQIVKTVIWYRKSKTVIRFQVG
jgi:hypothetical protein